MDSILRRLSVADEALMNLDEFEVEYGEAFNSAIEAARAAINAARSIATDREEQA